MKCREWPRSALNTSKHSWFIVREGGTQWQSEKRKNLFKSLMRYKVQRHMDQRKKGMKGMRKVKEVLGLVVRSQSKAQH